jgi:hypothetical protein
MKSEAITIYAADNDGYMVVIAEKHLVFKDRTDLFAELTRILADPPAVLAEYAKKYRWNDRPAYEPDLLEKTVEAENARRRGMQNEVGTNPSGHTLVGRSSPPPGPNFDVSQVQLR